MNGNFAFVAETDGGSDYSQPRVTFSGLPAVRVTISITQ
jgi:hypothetical protein